MSARDLSWLTARPIAHRGLHDSPRGVIENSIGAALAAIGQSYAIECDVQLTRDGDLVVFHDDDLDRLTTRGGRVADLDAAELRGVTLRGSTQTIPTFVDFLAAIAGRTPLVVEIKSAFDGNIAAARRAAEILAAYDGPVVVESFDPAPMEYLRANGAALGVPDLPLGIVGEATYGEGEWSVLSPAQRQEMTHFLHYPRTRPDFLSWRLADLPHAIPFLLREGLRLPVTVWTVRSQEQAEKAMAFADQIVFEGFTPDP